MTETVDLERLEREALTHRPARLRRRLLYDRLSRWLLPLTFIVVLFPLFDLIYWVGAQALPTFGWNTLTQNPVGSPDHPLILGGLFAPITGTLLLLAISTAVAGGLGFLAGLWTAEYAPSSVARTARIAGNLLAGIPAIVIGYFGYFLLVLKTGWGFTTIAGGLTLGIFMFPFAYRVIDLAFQGVPREQREAALAAGARRGQYLLRVALPIALPTILTGLVLAMAIGLGETAPLWLTAGWSNTPTESLFSGTSYLTGVVWSYYSQPFTLGNYLTLAFQAAFLLIVLVVALNVVVQVIAERYRRRLRGLF